MNLDKTVCYCFHVPLRKIVHFVKQTRPKRPSQISECFGAGSGCGWCIPELLRIYRQVTEGEPVTDDELSAEEYAALRAEYLRGIKEGIRERHGYNSDAPGSDAPSSRCESPEPDSNPRKPGEPGPRE